MTGVFLHRYGPAVVSALAVPLALPNELALLGNPLLGPVAFAPLFLSIYRSRSHAQAAVAAVLFMMVATPLSYYWLAVLPGVRALDAGRPRARVRAVRRPAGADAARRGPRRRPPAPVRNGRRLDGLRVS